MNESFGPSVALSYSRDGRVSRLRAWRRALGWISAGILAISLVPLGYVACLHRAERCWLSLTLGESRSSVQRKLWGFSSAPYSDPSFVGRYAIERYMKSPDQQIVLTEYWFGFRNCGFIVVYDADGNLLTATPP
jgi:hypothetical protein